MTKGQQAVYAAAIVVPAALAYWSFHKYALTMELQEAIAWRDAGAVQTLVENGADIYARTRTGHTALSLAASPTTLHMTNEGSLFCGPLLDEVARRGFPADCGDAALTLAIYCDRRDVAMHYRFTNRFTQALVVSEAAGSFPAAIKRLIEWHPEYVSYRTDSDGVPLLALAVSGHSSIDCADLIAYLIRKGADVNGSDSHGGTALSRAASMSPDAVEVLLAHGANPDAQDDTGNTALIGAAYAGEERSVRLLLEHRADPRIRNKRGRTAEMAAERSHHPRIAQLLRARARQLRPTPVASSPR